MMFFNEARRDYEEEGEDEEQQRLMDGKVMYIRAKPLPGTQKASAIQK